MMAMLKQPAQKPIAMHALMKTGLTLMAIAAVWWFAYYGQTHGVLGLLDIKYTCLAAESTECGALRDAIGNGLVPMYTPGVWWAGIACSLIGWFLSRRASNKA